MRARGLQFWLLISVMGLLLVPSPTSYTLSPSSVTGMSGDTNECLMFVNITHDYNYSEPSQDSFNITADLFNYCTEGLNYPSTLMLNDTQGINVSSDDVNWRYGIDGNSSYPVVWEVTRDSTVAEGTFVTFEMHPTRDNCYGNCTENQNYSYNLTVPFGLVDVNACYGIDNITDDYSPSQLSFNLSADLNNSCWGGDIHYPAGILNGGNGFSSSPVEGTAAIGQMAYMIFENTSTPVNWQITLDQNLANGTSINFSLQPSCAWYTSNVQIIPFYMQDCDLTTFDNVSYAVMNGTPSNQTFWPERIFVWPDGVSGYDTTQNYSLTYNTGDNISVYTLYELDNLVNNVTYLIEWYISNSSGTENFSSGNFTTNSTSNTGYSAPLPNASLNLSDGCYVVRAELHDDTGQLLDHDEFSLCISDGSNTVNNDSDGDGIPDSDDDCPNTTPSEVPVDSHGCPEESIYIWPDGVGVYAGSAHNYSLTFSATMNSMVTLYEVDYLAHNTTYLIEWYISNGSVPSYIADGNLTTDSVNNTGYAAPLHAALNLSDGCYAIWAELYDDTGNLLDDDEFTLCITIASVTSDSDGDGVLDGDDDCPNTPTGTAVDSHGCLEEIIVPTHQPNDGGLPGFSSILAITALLGAAFIRTRRD